MFRFVQRQRHGLLVLLAVMATAVSACGGGGGGSTSLSAAASAFANVNSYKFSMTLAGGSFGSVLSMLGPSSGSGNAPFTMTGTIRLKPTKAADISMAGLRIIEIGGQDYFDVGDTGSFNQLPVSGTLLADRLSPATMFSNAIDPSSAGGYNKVGSETKNGVQVDHYQASSSALAKLGSIAGINGATWTADVWIAQNGDYPISMAVVGKASDNSVAYEILFDITNVNGPSNTVTAPSLPPPLFTS